MENVKFIIIILILPVVLHCSPNITIKTSQTELSLISETLQGVLIIP